MIRLKKNIFFLLLLVSCGTIQDPNDSLVGIIHNKEESIKEIYAKIDEWPVKSKYENKFGIIKLMYFEEIRSDFSHLKLSLSKEDNNSFKSDLIKIIQNIERYLYQKKRSKTINNGYLWIYDDCIAQLKKLGEMELISSDRNQYYLCLEVEEKLIHTLYMEGYSDEYIFNKIDIVVKQRIHESDSAEIYIGIVAYDTLQCAKINYWIEKNGVRINKFSNCNVMKAPRGYGEVKMGGILDYVNHGDTLHIPFESEIEIK